jgi:hypothetical protein
MRLIRWLLVLCLTLAGQHTFAQSAPGWWSNYGVLSGSSPNDYAIANQGQAKNLAVAAVQEMDNDLAQFGGSQLDGLAATLLSGSATSNDYAAVNLGQLKALAQPFYDRLLSLGYTGSPLTSGTYPWATSSQAPNDYAGANIGQVKNAFSFDVTLSSDGSGVPDWWEQKYSVSGTGTVVWSEGQVTDLRAYQQGLNPIDFYNSHAPTLSIVSGNNQTGAPNGFAPAPLVVGVVDGSGNPLTGAPVTFTVTSGSGGLKKSYMTAAANSASVLTDEEGHATIYFQLPNVTGTSSQITATPGSGSYVSHVVFTESTGSGTYASPFAPSDVVVNLNQDGSIDMTWQNNNDDPSDIPITMEQPDGTWRTVTTVPAGTTSVHVPPQTP